MTIRDIIISLGFDVDEASERKAEQEITSLKDMAAKALGAIGIGISVAGVASARTDQSSFSVPSASSETS